jgi:hypothetical protein
MTDDFHLLSYFRLESSAPSDTAQAVDGSGHALRTWVATLDSDLRQYCVPAAALSVPADDFLCSRSKSPLLSTL